MLWGPTSPLWEAEWPERGKGFFLPGTTNISFNSEIGASHWASLWTSQSCCMQASFWLWNEFPPSLRIIPQPWLASPLTYMAKSAASTLMIYVQSSSMRKSGRIWLCGKNKAAPFSYSDISCALGSFKVISPGYHCSEWTCCVVLTVVPWETEFIIDRHGKQSKVVVSCICMGISFIKSKARLFLPSKQMIFLKIRAHRCNHKG